MHVLPEHQKILAIGSNPTSPPNHAHNEIKNSRRSAKPIDNNLINPHDRLNEKEQIYNYPHDPKQQIAL